MTPTQQLSGTTVSSGKLSDAKRRAFFVTMIFLPPLLLVIIEIVLRQIEYDGNLDLVVTKQIAGTEFYTINRNVAGRYFAGSGETIPEPPEDIFERHKSKSTKRIFCLGESTMAGFPYEFNATAPSMLRVQLESALPGYHIEVINAGLSAVSSYVVGDFINDLMRYKPDLFILYVGHNEFYGAYGIGSTLRIAGFPFLTDLTLWLLKFKAFLALRDLYTWVAGVSRTSTGAGSTMMQQMVKDQSIPYHSEEYEIAREVFRSNLESMISAAQDHGVPIVVSMPVSNLRDQQPFHPQFSDSTTLEIKETWRKTLVAGDSMMSAGQFEKAAEAYLFAVSLDLQQAEPRYKLGQALYRVGAFTEAREAFLKAKDLDGLRFRMSEEFGDDLLDVCRISDVPVARIDSAFSAASPHGIIGHELILEHLHPNIAGYALMAKVWAEAIKSHHLLVDSSAWSPIAQLSDEELIQRAGITPFDEAMGRLRIKYLTSRWPFRNDDREAEVQPEGPVETIALQYLQKKIGWQGARYELAAQYVAQREFEAARREAYAVSLVIPFSYEPLLRIADYFVMEGRKEEAVAAYRACIAVEDNPFARSKLALLLLDQGQLEEASKNLQASFSLEGSTQYKLPANAAAMNHYFLGYIFDRQGKKAEAIGQLQQSLAINPQLADAKTLLQNLQR